MNVVFIIFSFQPTPNQAEYALSSFTIAMSYICNIQKSHVGIFLRAILYVGAVKGHSSIGSHMRHSCT